MNSQESLDNPDIQAKNDLLQTEIIERNLNKRLLKRKIHRRTSKTVQ